MPNPKTYLLGICMLWLAFGQPLLAQKTDLQSAKSELHPGAGLLTLHLDGESLQFQLNSPLTFWVPEKSPEILSSSNPLLSTKSLNQRLKARLKIPWLKNFNLSPPIFRISESVGPDLFLISKVDLSWSWSAEAPKPMPKTLEIAWKGDQQLGFWVDWPRLQQKDFLIDKEKPLYLKTPEDLDFTQLIQYQNYLSQNKFLWAFFLIILIGSLSFSKKRPYLLLLPMFFAWAFWPLSQQAQLNPKLVTPWLENNFRESLLGKASRSPAQLYTKLAKTFSGDALEKIYLEQEGKNLSNNLASQKEVEHLSIHEVKLLTSPTEQEPLFHLQIDWTLSGVVQHLSHLHLRNTRHLDLLTIRFVDDELKITRFQPLEQRSERGEP